LKFKVLSGSINKNQVLTKKSTKMSKQGLPEVDSSAVLPCALDLYDDSLFIGLVESRYGIKANKNNTKAGYHRTIYGRTLKHSFDTQRARKAGFDPSHVNAPAFLSSVRSIGQVRQGCNDCARIHRGCLYHALENPIGFIAERTFECRVPNTQKVKEWRKRMERERVVLNAPRRIPFPPPPPTGP
jgi:hypothetical protein